MPTSYLIQYHKGYVLVHESCVRYGSCTDMMEIYTKSYQCRAEQAMRF